MSQAQSQPGASFVAMLLVLLMLLGVGYVGAYYALLESKALRSWAFPLDVGPVYRIKDEAIESILNPAHQLDRLLRPSYWQQLD